MRTAAVICALALVVATGTEAPTDNKKSLPTFFVFGKAFVCVWGRRLGVKVCNSHCAHFEVSHEHAYARQPVSSCITTNLGMGAN